MAFYLEPLINAGDLTELGRWQNERIAEIMYRDFPEVFTNGNKVLARGSDSPRSIISMSSCALALQKHAPWLDITVRSLHTDMPYTSTRHSPRQIAKHYAGPGSLLRLGRLQGLVRETLCRAPAAVAETATEKGLDATSRPALFPCGMTATSGCRRSPSRRP